MTKGILMHILRTTKSVSICPWNGRIQPYCFCRRWTRFELFSRYCNASFRQAAVGDWLAHTNHSVDTHTALECGLGWSFPQR